MNSTEVCLRFTKHISDLGGGIPMGFDTPLGAMIVEKRDGSGFSIHVDCSDTFMYACADSEAIETEEQLKLFLECSHIFIKQYTWEEVVTHWNVTFSDEQDTEYCMWVTKLYCSKVRGWKLLPPYYDEMPEWLKEHFPTDGKQYF